MFNLVEVQSALQSPSVQLADLMKYANGSSAEVPAYLALGELNRRKQLEATNTAFNTTPPTVKDQLTNAPPAVNPTAAPTGIAPTAAPTQLAATTAAPPRMNVAAAPANQVHPTAQAPSMMAAEGGLLSIPTPHMFHPESYANGGIVAFAEGDYVEPNAYQKEMQDKTEKLKLSPEQEARTDELNAIKYLDEAKAAKDNKEMETWKRGTAQTTDEFNALRAQRQAVEEKPAKDKQIADQMAADAASRNELMAARQAQQKIDEEAQTKKLRDTDEANAALMKPKSIYRPANDDESVQSIAHPKNLQGLESLKKVDILSRVANAGEAGVIPDAIKAGRVAPPVPTPVAPVVAPTGITPAAAPTGIATGQYKAQTALEAQDANMAQIDREQALRGKAGISDDPHKATRDRMDKLEAKRAAQEAEDPFNSLMARLAAYGKSTEQTFGGGMGDSAIAGAAASKESAALRDKQATEIIAARQAMETADDARKRGDLATVKAATKEAEGYKQKASELGSAAKIADAHVMTADTGQISAFNTIAWTPYHEATLRMEADAKLFLARNPHATDASIKANSIASIKREWKNDKRANPTGRDMTESEALSSYSIATNSSKTDISDERNLSRERLQANKDWENPMTVANARKMYGKDLPLPQLKAKFMDGRLSNLPGYTPEPGSKTTTEAQFNAMPKGTVYTAPDGSQRIKP